jgi:hypothetical protein
VTVHQIRNGFGLSQGTIPAHAPRLGKPTKIPVGIQTQHLSDKRDTNSLANIRAHKIFLLSVTSLFSKQNPAHAAKTFASIPTFMTLIAQFASADVSQFPFSAAGE